MFRDKDMLPILTHTHSETEGGGRVGRREDSRERRERIAGRED